MTFHLNVIRPRKAFDHLPDLLRPMQFPNRDLVQDHFLDRVLVLRKCRFIHVLDQVLPSLSRQDPGQDLDQLVQKKSKLAQNRDQDLHLDRKRVLVHLRHRQIDRQSLLDSHDQDQSRAP